MKTSTLPQELMSGSLLHFEQGVPIDDLALRTEQRKRLARVEHVYWQWIRNPFTIDYKALLRQLVKGHYADAPSESHAAQKDIQLFEFIKESISPMTRREAEVKAKVAIDRMLTIGMETDNVAALDKGTKHIITLGGLDKPEEQRIDMSKMAFLPPVVTTSVKDVDETKQDVDDPEMKRIMSQYNGFVDEKERDIERMVETMKARSGDE